MLTAEELFDHANRAYQTQVGKEAFARIDDQPLGITAQGMLDRAIVEHELERLEPVAADEILGAHGSLTLPVS